MSLYTLFSAQMKVARDSALTRLLFSDTFTDPNNTSSSEGDGQHRAVADSATDTINLGGVATGRMLWIYSTRQVDVLLTSAAGADQAVRIGNAATEAGFIMLLGPFTAVKITNNSGATANVTVGWAG